MIMGWALLRVEQRSAGLLVEGSLADESDHVRAKGGKRRRISKMGGSNNYAYMILYLFLLTHTGLS
jgi:hypothetical protein